MLTTLTAPLVAHGVRTQRGTKTLVYVVGSADTVYAIDDSTGRAFWQKSFPNHVTPVSEATWLCPNSQNATPVIDKDAGSLHVVTSDGKLRGLSLASGVDRFPAADFVPPHLKLEFDPHRRSHLHHRRERVRWRHGPDRSHGCE